MQAGFLSVSGEVVPGYRVASQPSKDYPYGTIDKQKPIFKSLGLDLDRFYSGTLNISIAPRTFSIVKPAYTFRHVTWTDLHPPEDFSFSPCQVLFNDAAYDGYIYFPHPETKKRHFENASLTEVISTWIPALTYGSRVELLYYPLEIAIHQ